MEFNTVYIEKMVLHIQNSKFLIIMNILLFDKSNQYLCILFWPVNISDPSIRHHEISVQQNEILFFKKINFFTVCYLPHLPLCGTWPLACSCWGTLEGTVAAPLHAGWRLDSQHLAPMTEISASLKTWISAETLESVRSLICLCQCPHSVKPSQSYF